MAAMAAIRFYFDYISPYSYLAWKKVHEVAARHDRDVDPVPILLGAVLDAMGTRGPAEIPARRAYLVKDLTRLARTHGVPFAPPPVHPFNPLLSLRVTCVPMPPASRLALIHALFDKAWAHGESIAEREAVAAVCRSVGLGDDVLAGAEVQENKDRLRRNTEEAIAAGAFGVPTLIVDGEMFFGQDSLPHLDLFLSGENPVTPEMVERWAKIPSGVSRRPR